MEIIIIFAVIAFLIYKFQKGKAHYQRQDELHNRAQAAGTTVPALHTLKEKEYKEVMEMFSVLAAHPRGICIAEVSGMVRHYVKGGPAKHDKVVSELMQAYQQAQASPGWVESRATTWRNFKSLYPTAVRLYGVQPRPD